MIQFTPTEEEPELAVATCEQCQYPVYRWRGEHTIECDTEGCGAIYNSSGQRLRDDLFSRPNPSDYDDDIGDMEGYELAMSREEE